MKRPLMGAAGMFAHLLGLSAKKAEEDDDRKQRDDESDEDYAKRMEEKDKEEEAKRAEEEKKEEEAKRAEEEKKKEEEAKKAEEEDDEADAEDKEEDEEKEARKGRAKSARERERARCAAIFAAASAGVRPDMAAHLAFNTGMKRTEAIALLDAAAAGGAPRNSLSSRMSSVKTPNVGASTPATPAAGSPAGTAAQMVAVYNKLRP